MKHGTNIYITNTVHKKNQTNKQTNTSPPRLHKNSYFAYAEWNTRQHIIMYKANIFMATKTQIWQTEQIPTTNKIHFFTLQTKKD